MRPSNAGTAASGLLFTGLYWEGDQALLTGLDGPMERRRPVHLGDTLSWLIGGPRRCIGIYQRSEGRRRPCPLMATAPDGQCDDCQRRDVGRQIARGQPPDALLDDPFVLYAAIFGDDLEKVGITAEHRGANRLREQGALSYCLISRGSFMAVRRSETLISGARVASERIASRTKQDAWWLIPNRDRRTARLAELHTMAAGVAGGVAGITTVPFEPVDQVPLYGLDREVPSRYERVVQASAGAVISGRLTHLIGKLAFLEAPSSTLLLDLRILEGWSLKRTDLPPDGLELESRSREAHARATQQTLF